MKKKKAVPMKQAVRISEETPASVVVNERGDILYIHSRTGRYLEPAPGDAGMNIARMAREGLRRELATALHKSGGPQRAGVQPGSKDQN